MQVQLENWGKKSIGVQQDRLLRPFEVYWMAIAIILRMLREKNRSPSFVHLMPPFLDCTEGCKQGIHFDFWQLL